MDNGESSYRRFLAGDDEGLHEIICSYRTGMILYQNSFVKNIRITQQNTKMGIHYRFQQGKVMVNARNFLGYDKHESGHLIINPEQAEIVKRILENTLRGKAVRRSRRA